MYYWQRNNANAIYVQKAIELASRLQEAFANRETKKYTFLGGQKIVYDAMEMANLLGKANRMRTDIPAEAKKRVALLRAALGMLDTVSGNFAVMHYKQRFPEGTLKDIDDLFWEVNRLINAVIESDAGRTS